MEDKVDIITDDNCKLLRSHHPQLTANVKPHRNNVAVPMNGEQEDQWT